MRCHCWKVMKIKTQSKQTEEKCKIPGAKVSWMDGGLADILRSEECHENLTSSPDSGVTVKSQSSRRYETKIRKISSHR